MRQVLLSEEDLPIQLPTGYNNSTYTVGFWNVSKNGRKKGLISPYEYLHEYRRLERRWIWRFKEYFFNSIGHHVQLKYSKVGLITGTILEYNGSLLSIQTDNGIKILNKRKVVTKSIKFTNIKENTIYKKRYRWKGEAWELKHEQLHGKESYGYWHRDPVTQG